MNEQDHSRLNHFHDLIAAIFFRAQRKNHRVEPEESRAHRPHEGVEPLMADEIGLAQDVALRDRTKIKNRVVLMPGVENDGALGRELLELSPVHGAQRLEALLCAHRSAR